MKKFFSHILLTTGFLVVSTVSFGQVTISAVTADLCPTDVSYTTLDPINFVETAATDIDSTAASSNVDTLTLKLSTGLEFNPGMTVSLTGSVLDISNFTTLHVGTDSAAFSYTVETKTNVDDINLTGIEVRATNGASSGSLDWNGGDAVLTGNTHPTTLANLSVTTLPTISTATTPQEICDGSSFATINLASADGGDGFVWGVKSTTNLVFASSGTDNTIDAATINLTDGTQNGELVFHAIATVGGCEGTDTTDFTIDVSADPTVTNATTTETVCNSENTSGFVLTSDVVGTVFDWSVVSTNVTGVSNVNGPGNIPSETVFTPTSGTITYTVIPSNGACDGTGNEVDFVITVGNTPSSATLTGATLPDTTAVCNAQDVVLELNSPTGLPLAWQIISGNSAIDGASNASSVTIDYGDQTGTIEVTEGLAGCETTTSFPLVPFGCDFIGFGPGNSVCEGTRPSFEVTDISPDIFPTYSWSAIAGSGFEVVGGVDNTQQSYDGISINDAIGSVTVQLEITFRGKTATIQKIGTNSGLPARISTITGPNNVMCGEQDVNYSVSGSDEYVWNVYHANDFTGTSTTTNGVSNNDIDFNTNVSTAYISVKEVNAGGCQLEEAGQALNFTGGGGDAYNIEKDVASSDMDSQEGSILMWVRTPLSWTNSYNGSGIIYYGSESGTNGYGEDDNGVVELTLAIRENRFVFDISENANNNNLDVESNVISPNTWYHLAVTWNSSGDMKMYVDVAGDELPQQTVSYGTKHNFDFTERHRFGRGRDDTRRFVGEIDNVSIWTRELSGAEVLKYKDQQVSAQPGLFAYYPFDPEDALADASGNGYTLAPESVSPTYEVSDYFSDVKMVTVDPFSFTLDVVDNSNPSTPNGSLSFNVGIRVFDIANDEGGFNWEPNDAFDGMDAATGLNTGTNLTLTVTNSAGCSDSETETVGGQSNVVGGNIEFSTTSAANYSVCQDSLVPPINNTVSPSGGDGNYTYSWWRSENGGPFLQIGSEDQIDLNLNAPPNNTAVFTSIKRITTDGNANTAESNTLTFFRIGRTALTIDIDTTVFGIINQEYYCENDGFVDLLVNAGGGQGYFLDGTDDPQYSYVLDAKGSNPQVDMSSASPGDFRDVVYVNYDLAPDRCPNFDTTRFAVIPNVDNNFTLSPNQTTADLSQPLLPDPWTVDIDDFNCTNCPDFQPFNLANGDTLEFNPAAFVDNEGVNYTIQYTYVLDSSGTNIQCKNIREKDVFVEQGVASFVNLGTAVCSSGGYISFTVDAGVGNQAVNVYGQQNSTDIIVSTTLTNGGQSMDVVIDPNEIPWEGQRLVYDPLLGISFDPVTYYYENIIFEYIDNSGLPTPEKSQRRVELINTPSPHITGLDLEYCVNETDIGFTINPSTLTSTFDPVFGNNIKAEGEGIIFSSLPDSGRLKPGNVYNPNELFNTSDSLDPESITYRYTVTNSSSSETICVIDSVYDIIIKDSPELIITNLQPSNHYCKNDSAGTLVASPAGGKFLSNITTQQGVYDPADIDIGNHTIEYAYTSNISQCSDTLTEVITMDTVPDIGIEIDDMIFCEDQDTLIIRGFVGQSAPFLFGQDNGIISGNGIIEQDTSKSIAFFDAAASGAQDEYVKILYNYTDGNGCSNLDSTEVYVRTLPVLSIEAFEFETLTPFMTDVCQEVETVRFIGSNANSNDIGSGETPPTYDWEINGFIENGDQDTLDYGITSFVDDDINVEYTYSDWYGCSSTVLNNYFVHASPTANFQEESNCIVEVIPFTDLSSTVTGSPDDGITSWSWKFGDFAVVGEDTSSSQNPEYKYNNPAVITSIFYSVQLAVSSQYGCVDTIIKQIEIGADPEVDFSWVNDCIGLGGGTYFTNNTSPFETLPGKFTTMYWDFDDGTQTTTFGNVQKDVKHAYQLADSIYNIEVIAVSPLGCEDTLVKAITTRNYLTLEPNKPHIADFETGLNGWYIDTSSTAAVNNAWDFGIIPDTKGEMEELSNGTNAFYTYAAQPDGSYINSSQSFVKSGCFDLRKLDKPMIKLDYYADMQGLDGAVVQVSIDTGATWQNLGSFDGSSSTGLNWYNSTLVAAKPGGISEQGWTTQSKNEQGVDSWIEARHTLNENNYNETTVVRFRIAFASNETNAQEGFAFDNIWIGNRTRLMLAEHFYNTFNADTSINTDIWNLMYDRSNPLDMIDISYPTNVLTSTIVNRDAVGQKEVDYGYPNIINPFTVLDGDYENGLPSAQWLTEVEQRKVDNRALIDSPVLIDFVDSTFFNGTKNVTLQLNIEAIDSLFAEDDIRLKVAIVETDVYIYPNGNTLHMRNLLRNSLGFISGYKINTPMNPGADTTLSINGDYSLVENVDNIAFVAYIQDNTTEEILQSYFLGTAASDIVTSLWDKVTGEEYKYILFPNPATNQTNIVFDTELKDDYDVTLVDNLGNVVDVLTMEAGSRSLSINTANYSSGLYIMYISNGEQVLGVDKLVIQK